MELLFSGLAAAGAGELFSYNRENFFFDEELRTERLYQNQEMRVRQFELYREDVRDLVDLTVKKMEVYLVVNTLQLGFCVTLFVEGRPEGRRHDWLVNLIAACNLSAFVYYILSMWLAMHASISAHSFGVRMLTQFVRLPVPNDKELDAARALSSTYEGGHMQDMLRVPLWKQQLRKFSHVMTADAATSDCAEDDITDGQHDDHDRSGSLNPVAMLRHVQLYRRLQTQWQSYDAYARVCMSMGTSQILYTLSYYSLGVFNSGGDLHIDGICCVVLFTCCAWELNRLDLYLSTVVLGVAGALLVFPPILACIAVMLGQYGQPGKDHPVAHRITHVFNTGLIVCVYALHVAWIVFILCVARADTFGKVALPKKFRSVLYLDVFDWLSGNQDHDEDGELIERTGPGGGGPSQTARAERPVALTEDGDEACTPQALPESLRVLLVEDCLRTQARLLADLRRWETPEVAELLMSGSDEASTVRELRSIRDRFDNIVADLAEETLAGRGDRELEITGDGRPVWLRMEYNPCGSPMIFYYSLESAETLWERPEGDVRFSDMQSLQELLATLGEQALALSGHPRGTSARSFHEAAMPAYAAGLAEALADDGRKDPSMDQSFGGREAAQLHRGGVRTFEGEDSFLPRGGGGDTVEPTQVAARATAAVDARAARAAKVVRRPGKLPWYTVRLGSLWLVAMWVVLTIRSFYRYSVYDGHTATGEDLEAHLSKAALLGDLAHPFLEPLGLACHPTLGNRALLAERYGVHEVELEPSGGGKGALTGVGISAAVSQAVAACMSTGKGLQARGIAGLSLRCSGGLADGGSDGAPQDCVALLSAADGRSLHRCPVPAARGAGEPAPHAQRFTLLGEGSWRGAADSVAVAASPGSVWAIGPKAVTLLGPTPGLESTRVSSLSTSGQGKSSRTESTSILAPRLELPSEVRFSSVADGVVTVSHNVTQLLDLGRVLLGVGPDGLLRAWNLAEGGPARAWHLPTGVRWGGGLCAAAGALYLAGSEAPGKMAGSRAGVWRLDMPVELMALVGDAGNGAGLASSTEALGW
mmetsp:Transcript_115930/g.328062  ORF Transcript_115930/g.328062 Transcript_115930/m.328062 type:complete len:1048 (-) Transcript_115930:133-3276(-)